MIRSAFQYVDSPVAKLGYIYINIRNIHLAYARPPPLVCSLEKKNTYNTSFPEENSNNSSFLPLCTTEQQQKK